MAEALGNPLNPLLFSSFLRICSCPSHSLSFYQASVRYVRSCSRRRYVNTIRGLKGARVYGYTDSYRDIGVSPRKILFDFLGHPSARRIQAKIREKSFPESPSFYYLSGRAIVRVYGNGREDSPAVFRPRENHARQYLSRRGNGKFIRVARVPL